LLKFFENEGFVFNRQKGSHIVLSRILKEGTQYLVVPDHAELDRGMTHGIFKQAREYLSEQDLRKFFYTK